MKRSYLYLLPQLSVRPRLSEDSSYCTNDIDGSTAFDFICIYKANNQISMRKVDTTQFKSATIDYLRSTRRHFQIAKTFTKLDRSILNHNAIESKSIQYCRPCIDACPEPQMYVLLLML